MSEATALPEPLTRRIVEANERVARETAQLNDLIDLAQEIYGAPGQSLLMRPDGALVFASRAEPADDPGIEDDGAVVPDVSEPARSE